MSRRPRASIAVALALLGCSLGSLDEYFEGGKGGSAGALSDGGAGKGGAGNGGTGHGGTGGTSASGGKASGGSCGADKKLCGANCVSTTDPQYGCAATACGACTLDHVNVAGCDTSGSCAPLKCQAGYDDCDNQPSNGCESELASDAANCGTCLHACQAVNAQAVCSAGKCAPVCSAGFGDCDANPDNGCETNLQTDAKHCGACDTPCAAGHACEGGQCCGLVGAGCGVSAQCCSGLVCYEPPAAGCH